MLKKIFTVICFCVLFCTPVNADEIERQMEIAGVGEMGEAAEGAKKFDEKFDFEERVKEEASGRGSKDDGLNILAAVGDFFLSSLREGIAETSKIMLAVFIFGIILRFLPDGISAEAAFFTTYAVLFSMALYIFQKAVEVASEVIYEMNFFVKASVPVMCTLAVPGGKFVSSVGTATLVGGICVVTECAAKILLPLTSMMAALSAANSLSGDMSMKGLERLIRKIVMWSVGIITTIFVTLIKIRGITGASLDNVTGKTIKFAVGNMVPVVGGIISDSLDNIISYSRAIQGSCGAVGIIALIYMIIPPVMQIAGMLIAFRLTGIITSPVTDGRINGAIDGFSDILGMLLIITVVTCILFITAMGSLAT